jgi:hypothetical protein
VVWGFRLEAALLQARLLCLKIKVGIREVRKANVNEDTGITESEYSDYALILILLN